MVTCHPTRPAIAILFWTVAALTAAPAAGQGQSDLPTRILISCWLADKAVDSAVLGARTVWIATTSDGVVYELAETAEGWRLIRRSGDRMCAFAAGEEFVIAPPAAKADQAPAQ